MALCIICLENSAKSTEQLVALQACGHVFHEACIKTWIVMENSCPTCRKMIPRQGNPYMNIFMPTDKSDDDDDDDSGLLMVAAETVAKNKKILLELTDMRDHLKKVKDREQRSDVQQNLDAKKMQAKIDKLSASLNCKQRKLENDMALKNKLRAENKALREALAREKRQHTICKLKFRREEKKWREMLEQKNQRLAKVVRSHYDDMMRILSNGEPPSTTRK